MRQPTFFLSLLALMALTACETVKGVGRDVGATGEAITDTSRQVQSEL